MTNGYSLQLFEPAPDALYTIDALAEIVDVPRRTILVYCSQGLVSPVTDPAEAGYRFNNDALRAIRSIEALRKTFNTNLSGIRMILDLMREVERLRSELRWLRR